MLAGRALLAIQPVFPQYLPLDVKMGLRQLVGVGVKWRSAFKVKLKVHGRRGEAQRRREHREDCSASLAVAPGKPAVPPGLAL